MKKHYLSIPALEQGPKAVKQTAAVRKRSARLDNFARLASGSSRFSFEAASEAVKAALLPRIEEKIRE